MARNYGLQNCKLKAVKLIQLLLLVLPWDRGINIMNFCKLLMKRQSFMVKQLPVVITVYKDKKFDFIIKSPPASHFIREAAKLKSGSKEPGRVVAGSITMKQAEAIAKEKMKDLNAFDIKEATKIICGSARSMGIEVKE